MSTWSRQMPRTATEQWMEDMNKLQAQGVTLMMMMMMDPQQNVQGNHKYQHEVKQHAWDAYSCKHNVWKN